MLKGEPWVKGLVKGYWNKPDGTAKTFVDGWVKTGDLARLAPLTSAPSKQTSLLIPARGDRLVLKV
jgi:acyl-CoA synthetase (AMP-forming)/AMP-acid ligase II